MKVTLDPRAADELASQIDYLIDNYALLAAARLKARCDAFFEKFLARHPRTGKHIAERDIWETWIPARALSYGTASRATSCRSYASGTRPRIVSESKLGDGDGGRIIAAGTPEDVAKTKESYTGQYLKELLGRRAKAGKQAAE